MRPATELIRMSDPPPASMRWGMAAMQVFQVPVRLVPMTVSHTSGVTSSQRWTVQTPALAMAMSSRPSRSTPSATAAARASPSRTSTSALIMVAPVSVTNRVVSARSAGVASG